MTDQPDRSGRKTYQTVALTTADLGQDAQGLPFARSDAPQSVPTPGYSPLPQPGFGNALGATRLSQPAPPMPVHPGPPTPAHPGPDSLAPHASPLVAFPASQPSRPSYAEAAVAAPLASVRAYSDEAADTVRRASTRRREKPRVQIQRQCLVDLVAFEPGLGKRLRKTPELAELLVAQRGQRSAQPSLPHEAPAEAEREALEALTICSFAPSVSMRALREGQERMLQDLERLEIPLGVVRGTLTPTLDQEAALRILGALAQPLSARDKRAQAVHAATEESAVGMTSWRGFERLASQLDAVFSALGTPGSHATEFVTRKVLEERAYRRRSLLGKPRIRAELELEGTQHVVYLPELVQESLPLLRSFQVVAIVELRPREDASEQASESLLCHAISRVLAVSPGA